MSQTNEVDVAGEAGVPVRAPAMRAGTRLVVCGVIAGPCYVLVSLAQAWLREGFDLTRHAWSLLANGSLGWIQMANLMVTGALVVAGAAGLCRVLAPGATSGPGSGTTWPHRLLSVYGLTLVGAGVFRADPAQGFPPGTPGTGTSTSWHGVLHFVLAGIGFVCLVLACFVVAHHCAAAGLRGWSRFSRTTAVVFLAGFVAMAASGGRVWANLAFTAAIVLAWAWLSMILMLFHGRAPRGSAA